MGVNSAVGMQGKGVASKYHDEEMLPTPGNPAGNMPNPQPPVKGGAMMNPGNMDNPMMAMNGGGSVPGTENMSNPMMPLSGSAGQSGLSSQSEVYETNPQGHKVAPLAGKLRKYR